MSVSVGISVIESIVGFSIGVSSRGSFSISVSSRGSFSIGVGSRGSFSLSLSIMSIMITTEIGAVSRNIVSIAYVPAWVVAIQAKIPMSFSLSISIGVSLSFRGSICHGNKCKEQQVLHI